MRKNVTQKVVSSFIKEKLKINDKWALRALDVVFNFQTEMEKNLLQTREHNNVGFTSFDAEFLTSLALQFRERGCLSPKQMSCLHKLIPKYWKQILSVSNKEKLELIILKTQVK